MTCLTDDQRSKVFVRLAMLWNWLYEVFIEATDDHCLSTVANPNTSLSKFIIMYHSISSRVHLNLTPSLSKSKGPVFSFETAEFCYKGSNICAIQALWEKIHFDISGHFVITEFEVFQIMLDNAKNFQRLC